MLKRYPHSVECLFELAQANFWSKTDDGFERAIPLYERVLDEATDDGIRSSSLEGLCRCYRETGNIDAAVRTAKRGTSWRSSKQFLMTQIPESPEHKRSTQIWISICAQELAWNLNSLSFDSLEDVIDDGKKALAVLDMIYLMAIKCGWTTSI